jgi:hypothetical protein
MYFWQERTLTRFDFERDFKREPRYTVKKGYRFSLPSRDATYQTLPGWELLNYSQPGRVWLVTSRLGTGKITNFFLQCRKPYLYGRRTLPAVVAVTAGPRPGYTYPIGRDPPPPAMSEPLPRPTLASQSVPPVTLRNETVGVCYSVYFYGIKD